MSALFCVVCGRASSRSVWNNQIGSFVACDFHGVAEINYAVANATTPNPSVTVTDPSIDVSPQT